MAEPTVQDKTKQTVIQTDKGKVRVFGAPQTLRTYLHSVNACAPVG